MRNQDLPKVPLASKSYHADLPERLHLIVKIDYGFVVGHSCGIMEDISFQTILYSIVGAFRVKGLDRELALVVESTESRPENGRTRTSILRSSIKADILRGTKSPCWNAAGWRQSVRASCE